MIDVTTHAEPAPDTHYTGEEGHHHAECVNCGGDIFCDQEFDNESEQMIPREDLAYWQHNDERYRPNHLSWCKP